jgi:hypothetical protein
MPIGASAGTLDIENATLRSNAIAVLTNLVAGNDQVRQSGPPALEVYGDPSHGGNEPRLELVSNIADTASNSFTRLTSNAGVFSIETGTSGTSDNGTITFGGFQNERLRITSDGNVGIGTMTPGRPLEIAAGGGGAILNIKRTDAGSGQGAIGFVNMNSNVCASITSARSGAEGGQLIFFTAPNDTTQTSDNPYLINERMRITADGNVGIGTTNPIGVNGERCLEGSSSTGFEYIATRDDTTGEIDDFVGAYLFKNADTEGNSPHYAGMSAKMTGTNGPMNLRFHTNRDNYEADTPQMIIDQLGNVGIGVADPGQFKLNVNGTAHLPSIHRTNFTKELSEYFELVSGTTSTVTLNSLLIEINVTGTDGADQSEYAGTIDLDILGQRTNSTYGEDIVKTQLHFTAAWNEQSDQWQRLQFIQEIKAQDINSYRCITSIPVFRFTYIARKLQIYIQYNALQYRVKHSFTARVSSDEAFAGDIISYPGGAPMSGTDAGAVQGLCYGIGGNVSIGTTDPGAKLDVRTGDIRFGDNVADYDIAGFVDEYGGITVHSSSGNLGYNISTGNSTESWCWRFVDGTAKTPGTDYFRVEYPSGDYYHKGTSISDRRTKTNFVSIDGVDALNSITKLNPLVYNDKTSKGGVDNRLKGGFIAQEVLDVIPHLVSYDEDRDKPNENGYATAYALDYNGVFAYNVKATQEIYKLLLIEQTKVTNLEARILALESA